MFHFSVMQTKTELLQGFLDDITSPEVIIEIMKEVKLARGMCTTYYAKLVQLIKKLPDDTRKEIEKFNIYSGVLYSLIGLIELMDSVLLLKNISKIKNILCICYPCLSTLRTFMSHLKYSVCYKFESFPEIIKAAKETLCLSQEDYKELDLKYSKLVVERNKNQETLSDLLIFKIIDETKESLKWEEKMIAIALSCGSRMIEIAKVSNYEPIGGEPFKILIIGTAKSREKKVTVKKPVVGGLRAGHVIHLVRLVRDAILTDYFGPSQKEKAEVSNKELTTFIARRIYKYVRRHLGIFIEGKLSFHTLRSIYAEMAWVESEGTHTMSKTAFYSEVLGHNPNDIKTALSYQRFVVKPGSEVKEVKKPITYTDNVLKAKKNKKKANFKGKNGWFSIEKKKNSKRMENLEADAKILQENGIKLTYDNLRRCGYGTILVRKFKQKQKMI